MSAATMNSSSRKRLRAALLGLVCIAACQDVTGFMNSQRILRSTTTRPAQPLFATTSASRTQTKSPSPQAPPRLSHAEQRELLGHAVEARRIRAVESELALQSASLMTSALAIARQAGYGDDLVEYERAVDRGQRARETLVTRNMGLVYYCVKEIMGKRRPSQSQLQSVTQEDLVQEGAIGLARAVDRWNPEIGGKFSTYAVYWIRAAALRCIAERDDLMRVPEHVSAAVRKMTKAAKNMGLDIDGDNLLSNVYNSDDSWKEAQAAKALAEEAGLTDKQLMEAMKVRDRRNRGIMSYDAWMQQGRDYETDLSPVASVEEDALSSVKTENLKKTLARFLRPKEMEALSWRYGLNTESITKSSKPRDYVAEAEEELFGSQTKEIPVRGKWGEAMSFVEVGKKMQCSAEYGRRLCHAALDKLRQAAEEGVLEPALLY